MRIKDFKTFNESFEVTPPKMNYMKSIFIMPMKDVDLAKKDVEGSTLMPKVPQFDIVKTIAIMLEDGHLVKQAAALFPNTDLKQAMNEPGMLGQVEKDKLLQIYNDIILKDYVLRQKYDLLP